MDAVTLFSGSASAFLATLVGAFSGGGSSLVLLPLLLLFTPGTYISSLAITKVSAITMNIIAARMHSGRNKLHMGLYLSLTLCGLVGTAIGTYLVQYRAHESIFKLIIAMTLLGTATYLFISKDLGLMCMKPKEMSKQIIVVSGVFSLLLNIFNGLFGGTGIFMTFYLVFALHMSFICAIAYTMSVYVIISSIQTAYLLATVGVNYHLAIAVVVGAVCGSIAGTHLQYLKGNLWVKRAAISVMFIIGLRTFAGLYLDGFFSLI